MSNSILRTRLDPLPGLTPREQASWATLPKRWDLTLRQEVGSSGIYPGPSPTPTLLILWI